MKSRKELTCKSNEEELVAVLSLLEALVTGAGCGLVFVMSQKLRFLVPHPGSGCPSWPPGLPGEQNLGRGGLLAECCETLILLGVGSTTRGRASLVTCRIGGRAGILFEEDLDLVTFSVITGNLVPAAVPVVRAPDLEVRSCFLESIFEYELIGLVGSEPELLCNDGDTLERGFTGLTSGRFEMTGTETEEGGSVDMGWVIAGTLKILSTVIALLVVGSVVAASLDFVCVVVVGVRRFLVDTDKGDFTTSLTVC